MVVSYQLGDGRFVASRPVPFLRDGSSDMPDDSARRVAPTDVYQSYNVSADGRLIVSLYESSPTPRVHIALDGLGELERQAAAER